MTRTTHPANTPASGGNEPTLSDLHAANVARQAEWCAGGDPEPDLAFRGNELAGEVGEACNVIKKLERERHGWRGSRATVDQLAEELADVVICADLCAMTAGIDLGAAVVAKFNATSEKVGLTTKLAARAAPTPQADGGVVLPVGGWRADCFRNRMADFDAAYRSACASSQAFDWMLAAQLAQQFRNVAYAVLTGEAPKQEPPASSGWMLVPREPTNEMVQAGGQMLPPTERLTDCYDYFREAWTAALEARPLPPIEFAAAPPLNTESAVGGGGEDLAGEDWPSTLAYLRKVAAGDRDSLPLLPIEARSILARLTPASRPAEQGGPVAWAWEAKRVSGYTLTKFSTTRPSEAEARNIRPLFAHPAPAASRPAVGREEIAKLEPCSEEEIEAWEQWATGKGFDMHEHPLHYLFMEPRTAAARQGWTAGSAFALALLDPRDETRAGGDEAQEGGWLPIETAVRDSRSVDLGFWVQMSPKDPEDRIWVVTSGWYEAAPADRCWYSSLTDEPVQPTHWRPATSPAPETRDDTRDGGVS